MRAVTTRVAAAVLAACIAAPVAAAAGQPHDGATFTRDVLPLLQRSCQQCHRPGTGAPMSLLTYEETRPWARAIRERVTARQMPPWHLDRSIGEYVADPSLSDAEIATIAAWVEAGAPRGNPADAPAPLQFAELNEWTYGEPDLIVQMEEGFRIPAEGADFYPTSSGCRSSRRPTAASITRTCTSACQRQPKTARSSGSAWVRTPARST